VLSTLHTIDAGQTINRIVGMFEQAEEQLIRNRLSTMLRWIVAQRLLPKIGGGRLAVLEILRSNLRVQESIMHGESEGKTFYEIIDAGVATGMQTFDKSVLQGYADGLITEQTAMAYASQRSIVRRGIDQIKNARGEKTTDLEGLALDEEYDKQFIREKGRR
jgi:twitching motility protein PilT